MVWRGLLATFRVTDRLAVRLALLLTLALLPLGVLAMLTSLDSRRTDLESAERALVSLTVDTAAGKRALVESAFTTARTLVAPLLERLDDPEACRALLADTVRQAGLYGFAGFIEPDGTMRCASEGAPQDFSDSAAFRESVADPRPLVRRTEAGAVTGETALIVMRPVVDDGRLHGFLAITLPLHAIGWLDPHGGPEGEVRPILLNRLGEVLSMGGDGATPEAWWPAGVTLAELAERGAGSVVQGRTEGGERAVFSFAELVHGQLYVLGVWAPDAAPAAALSAGRWPWLFPLMMWVASIATVYFALHVLVIRHLRQLMRHMRRFALGDRDLPADPEPDISRELREVHSTFHKMAALVARDEAELSAALAEKEEMLRERTVLLKEVHHRVKNNLQLIASILNLQMRRLQDPRSRRVLQNVQDRVIGLASVHRSLYRSDQLSRLRADALIDEVLRHLFAVGTDTAAGVDLQTDLAPATLEADQLVPLSLLVTEAVTNALKYGGPPAGGGRAWLRLRLWVEDGRVRLDLANSLGPQPDAGAAADGEDSPGTSLGNELIEAFAMQLGAEYAQGPAEEADGPCWRLRLEFPLRAAGEAPEQPAAATA